MYQAVRVGNHSGKLGRRREIGKREEKREVYKRKSKENKGK